MERQTERKGPATPYTNQDPPLVLGPQRLHYLYSTVASQAPLVLVSVVQGVAFTILFLSFTLPPIFTNSLPIIFSYLLSQYFYLPFILSSFFILFIWLLHLYVILFRIWPVSFVQIGLVFLLAFFQVIAFQNISRLSIWMFSIGCVFITGGYTNYRNHRLQSPEDFDDLSGFQQAGALLSKQSLKYGKLFMSIGFVYILLAFVRHYIASTQGFHSPISMLVSWSLLLFSIISTGVFFFDERSFRQRFLALLVKESGLVVTAHGVIRYASYTKNSSSTTSLPSRNQQENIQELPIEKRLSRKRTSSLYIGLFFSTVIAILGYIYIHLLQDKK